jgi:hypothetical protein
MSAIHNDPRDVWERGYVPPNKPIAYSEGIDDGCPQHAIEPRYAFRERGEQRASCLGGCVCEL